MDPEHYEHFSHDADIGVRGIGRSKTTAFEQAALALTAVITDPALVKDEQAVTIVCSAPSDELLLVDWLNALIYEMATRRMLFSRFHVKTTNHRLNETAYGEEVERPRHRPAVEIKGATYTALSLRRAGDVWIAECIVDV